MTESRIARDTRDSVARRAHHCCEYCRSQLRYSADPFSVEHIIPLSSGGDNGSANLALACQGCNGRKYTATSAVDPVSGEAGPLFHPRVDRWDEHFTWSADLAEIIGLSRVGRATIARLELNRAGVMNLRRVLVVLGLHPPR
jgi:hypothetical protein